MEAVQMPDEQKCKNCGAVIDGKFCKECGQKAIEHKQTIWHLTMHFLSDILHYDGRFIRTLRSLLTRPGFLSMEYMKGVRQKYVDPFRLYLFISALAFVVFITFDSPQKTVTKIHNPDIIHIIDSTRAALQADTIHNSRNQKSRYNRIKFEVKGTKIVILDPPDILKRGEHYYDSVQNTLTPQKRSIGYLRYKDRKFIKAYEVFDTAPYNYSKKMDEKISLIIPKSFFVSMPFFILTLFLLYFKKRNLYPSAHHAIFTLHFYTTVWVFITLDTIISTFLEHPRTIVIYRYIGSAIYLGLIVYLFVALSRFYKERWWVTLIKVIILTTITAFIYLLIMYTLREYFILSLNSISA